MSSQKLMRFTVLPWVAILGMSTVPLLMPAKKPLPTPATSALAPALMPMPTSKPPAAALVPALLSSHVPKETVVHVSANGLPIPGPLEVVEIGPNQYRISWPPVGEGLKYRVYASERESMWIRKKLTRVSLAQPDYELKVKPGELWVAVCTVKDIFDESDLSQPVHLK